MKRTASLLFASLSILLNQSQAADVRQGLVSYWPLDTLDLAGNNTPDVAAGNHMVLNNITDASSLVTGKFGKALHFDSSVQQCAYFTGDPAQDLGLPVTANAAYSILLWVNATGTGQSDLRYFCESDVADANNNPLYALGSQSAGASASTRIYLRNSTGGVLVDNTPTNAVLDGTWRHVAAVYDAGAFTLYVDGQKAYSGTYAADTANVWDTTSIGGIVRAAMGSFISGSVDDVAVWARALSQAEVQSVMTTGVQTPVPQFAPGFSANPAGNTNLLNGDTVILKAGVYGTRPMTYQWTKNGAAIAGATSPTLSLTSVTAADSGDYALVASNSQGSTTSGTAKLTVNAPAPPNISSGLIAYWPLDTVIGTKTPDLVSGYDMTLVNMTATNLVAGKWSKAIKFDNATHTLLQRVDNKGEDLPAYSKPDFSLSLWLNGAGNQSDRRVWSEGSTANNNPLFNLGTHNGGADGTIDSYIRTDAGATGGDHKHSTGTVFDDTWHNVVYVQRGGGTATVKASLYVDGVLDPIVLSPVSPLTLNTTTIGGILRSSASSWFSGMIDEVAVWNRALSPDEVQILQTTVITNPPSRLQPLAINAFKADLPAVVSGGSTVLRWDVSKDAGQVKITSIGDVTAATVVGIGATNITLASATTYVLTATRGVDTLSATTSVAVVTGVAPGWALLDNFDTYSPGPLSNTKWWLDLRGNSVQVVAAGNNGNGLTTPGTDADAILDLKGHTVTEGQASTLFFRMTLPAVPDTATPLNLAGLTDKAPRSLTDLVATTGDAVAGGLGPVVYPSVIVDPTGGTNAWFLGARNGISMPMDYTAGPLQPGATYNVWLEVTNAPAAPDFQSDVFSVYLQKEGDATRTKVYDSYASDRDPNAVDVIIGGMQPSLDKLVVAGDDAVTTATFDDFYLGNGYVTTVPVSLGHNTGPLPALKIASAGAQLQITWTAGALQSAPAVTGPWQNVAGATSPFSVTPATGQVFYRASQ